MRILLLDDEQLALESLESAVRGAAPEAELFPFRKIRELLEFVGQNPCDIAFLDIEMRGMNGIELAKMLKELVPAVNIIFVTGYAGYMGDAFGIHASGYILKPATSQAVREELDNLRHPLPAPASRLRIQTFGNFEVFYGKEILRFGRSKAKEMFAYFIDRRGAGATMAEIASVLWEDGEYSRSKLSQMHTFLADIRKVLSLTGNTGVLVKRRNSIAVDVDSVDCDYYNFLKGDVAAINSFTGEYMTNYAWAEFTVGSLSMLSKGSRASG